MKITLSKRREDGQLFLAVIALVVIGVVVGGVCYHYTKKWMQAADGPPEETEPVVAQYNSDAPTSIDLPNGTVIVLPSVYGGFSVIYIDWTYIPYDDGSGQSQGVVQHASGTTANPDHATIEMFMDAYGNLRCAAVNDSGWTNATLDQLGVAMDPSTDLPYQFEGTLQGSSWGTAPADTNTVTITIFKSSDLSLPRDLWTNLVSMSGYSDQTNVYYDYDWSGTNYSPAFYYAVYTFPTAPMFQPTLSICMDSNMLPIIGISGTIGRTYTLQWCADITCRTNAWANLASIGVSNCPQYYLDVSAVGHSSRFYRLVQIP